MTFSVAVSAMILLLVSMCIAHSDHKQKQNDDYLGLLKYLKQVQKETKDGRQFDDVMRRLLKPDTHNKEQSEKEQIKGNSLKYVGAKPDEDLSRELERLAVTRRTKEAGKLDGLLHILGSLLDESQQ